MAEPRRMRRFVADCGTEFDETLDGLLRRRLQRGDKSPIPKPQLLADIEQAFGVLREMSLTELKIEKGWARR